MPAAKAKNPLLKDIATLSDRGIYDGKKRPWWIRLKESHPEFYADMMEVVTLFLADDAEIKRKLPSDKRLAEYFCPKLKEHGFDLRYGSFTTILREMRSGQ
jgi:hypothetical protein